MHPSCLNYKMRLMRMKTVGSDLKFAHPSTTQSSLSRGDSSSPQATTPREKHHLSDPRGSWKQHHTSQQLWMRNPSRRQRRARHLRHPVTESSTEAPETSDPPSLEPLLVTQETRETHGTSMQPMQRFPPATVGSGDAETDMETRTCCLDDGSTGCLLDLQTNNSRRGASGSASGFGRRGGVTTTVNNANSAPRARSPDLSDTKEPSEYEDGHVDDDSSYCLEQDWTNSNIARAADLMNKNAVAKGANALVKQATSRQTEIIDTSKLLEEGKVETQYEEPEEPELIEPTDYRLIDEYEKTFAYARRLRALLNMKFKVLDRNSIETNFLLVKAHEHPTQRVIERWRNVDFGQQYDAQIRLRKLIDDFKQTCSQKKAKKGEVRIPIYPDWMKFFIRFKKDNSDKRWADYTAYKQKMKKLSGGKIPVPKANDKYIPAYYDVWSTSIVVYAKPESTLLDMIDPTFSKLGLEARADFKFTIGCFLGDKRSGKSKIPGAPADAEEVSVQVMCADLYKRNCLEIFVNDNRVEMFQDFPSFFQAPGAPDKKSKDKESKDDKKGKKGKKGKEKNQSNLDSDSELQIDATITSQMGKELQHDLQQQLQKSRSQQQQSVLGPAVNNSKSDLSENRQGDTTLATKQSLADEVVEFDTSPSATNQNLSVHDCDSSDEYDTEPIAEGHNSTTKSGRSETTKRESG